MKKTKGKKYVLLTFDERDWKKVKETAKKNGLPAATYVRMITLQSLQTHTQIN
ncbi:MAG: hypothetical protein LWW94_06840 [Candidatus Desulfofervidaceae bacterium]|nr:hypothetical protein [Candidatus Desulfofervidaceae bacterium]